MSRFAFLLSCALLILSSVFYYPKWKQTDADATISWDVSGYYLYLPAALIYHDIKQLNWFGAIDGRYHPGPGMGQVFKHKSGNYVMKYPMGQALQFLPWFLTAHVLAEPLGYPADGFSRPYQAAISWGSLLVAFLGLWFLRRVLLCYFSDGIVAAVLLSIVFGSNYLDYAGITGAMTHNWLFTVYSILIFSTIQFYKKPTIGWAALIGLLVGWATLTRPTEIISALIPLLWGIHSMASLRGRMAFFRSHASLVGLSVLVAGMVMFFQAAYWKYASGEWIVYSYETQGFSWLSPHIGKVLWSAKAGWLVYSPIMVFAVAGLFLLRKRIPEVFPVVIIYCLTAFYITAAWDIWWYGGSLGQRAMVQAYPMWAFALGAFWGWASKRSWRSILFVLLAGACIYINLWWTHQAQRGEYFYSEQMTGQFILKTLGRFNVGRDCLKLLDNEDEFTGAQRENVREILSENFEQDTSAAATTESPIEGRKSVIINGEKPFSPEFILPVKPGQAKWIRASVAFQCHPKEVVWWQMTQFIVRFKQGDALVKESAVRLQRHVDGEEVKSLFFDTKMPTQPFDKVSVFLWNGGSNKTVKLDVLKAELFD